MGINFFLFLPHSAERLFEHDRPAAERPDAHPASVGKREARAVLVERDADHFLSGSREREREREIDLSKKRVEPRNLASARSLFFQTHRFRKPCSLRSNLLSLAPFCMRAVLRGLRGAQSPGRRLPVTMSSSASRRATSTRHASQRSPSQKLTSSAPSPSSSSSSALKTIAQMYMDALSQRPMLTKSVTCFVGE